MSFVSSVYTFTDPIRIYKANDPYYFEVDNIPLKQLEENDLWLKDQLASALGSTLNREIFAELQPYVNGSDNIVRVRPGRFSARINDVSNKSQLQALKNESTILGGNKWTIENFLGASSFTLMMDQIISTTTSLEFNGLESRILNFSQDITETYNPALFTQPGPFTLPVPVYNILGQNVIAQSLAWAATEFIKAFRAPGRTAIVDVHSELTIPIEKWNNEDFFYVENGIKINIPATTRIDLLAVIAHPIDTSSTRIYNPDLNNSITTITEPRLVVIKGAGIGLIKTQAAAQVAALASNNNANFQSLFPVQGTDSFTLLSEEPYKILPNVADQNNANLGFKGLNIKGTFPSPDDLLNVAPLLKLDGSKTQLGTNGASVNDFQLVGQSVLPLAYIVVKNTTTTDFTGNPILQNSNLVDIRPFFRTTEFTYNERAGIVAAVPQLSLANPVTTRRNLDDAVKALNSNIQTLSQQVSEAFPRPIAAGMIWGGLNYGPEGAIDNIIQTYGGTQQLIFSGINSNVPAYPDWDDAEWWTLVDGLDTGTKGQNRNDKINFYYKNAGQNLDGGAGNTGYLGVFSKDFGTVQNWIGTWVKKTFTFDKSQVTWMVDYDVDVTLENCVGMSSKFGGEDDVGEAGNAGVFVEKNETSFTIYVFWISTGPYQGNLPYTDRNSLYYTQWVARHSSFPTPLTTKIGQFPTNEKYPLLAACTYPTVSFKVTGYPSGYFTNSFGQSQTPLITFK